MYYPANIVTLSSHNYKKGAITECFAGHTVTLTNMLNDILAFAMYF